MGLSSWLLVSGVFAAAAWAVQDAPEHNALFAHLDVAVQTANLAPAILVLFTPKGWVGRHSHHLTGALLLLGTMAALWLLCASNFHTDTASVGLLVGAAASGILGCTSMIAFFPYAASLGSPMAVPALSVGVGACGLVAFVLKALSKRIQILSDAQGYFSIVLCIQFLGLASFLALERRGKGENLLHGAELIQPSATYGSQSEPLSQNSPFSPGESSSWGPAGWLKRHIDAMRKTTSGPLVGIMLTAMLQYAMPGLLPYLCRKNADGKPNANTLFLLTAFWNASTLPGRLIAARCSGNLGLANFSQALIMAAALVYSACGQVPSILFALPAVIVFSFLHGLVVTASFLAAEAAGGQTGTTYCGLFNQIGAWAGSMLSLAFVALKLSKKS